MKALVLFSGGVDSTTCLALAVEQYGKDNVVALSIAYGQKHSKELDVSKAIASYYDVEYITLDLAKIFTHSTCCLLEHSEVDIPKGDYSNQLKSANGNPVSTYVPFRNGLFLSSAASIALSKECEIIYYGAHSDDAAGSAYPDCSNAFNEAMNMAIYEGSGKQLRISAPFVSWTKADIVKKGVELKVPYELTWSCYEGGNVPCGTCGTCIDRKKAFEMNSICDLE